MTLCVGNNQVHFSTFLILLQVYLNTCVEICYNTCESYLEMFVLII